jgi:hypothetical protein
VVDSGVWPAGPGNLVQDLEPVGTEQLQDRTGEMLAALTQFKLPCGTSSVDGAPPLLSRGHIVDIASLILEKRTTFVSNEVGGAGLPPLTSGRLRCRQGVGQQPDQRFELHVG